MAAPLPSPGRLSVLPQAPQVNPADFNAANLISNAAAAQEKIVRLTQLSQQMEMEKQKRQYELKALDYANRLHEQDMQKAALDLEIARRREQEDATTGAQQRLANLALAQQQAATAAFALEEQKKDAELRDRGRKMALEQLDPSAPVASTPPALPAAPVDNGSPYVPNTDLGAWSKQQVALEIAATGKPTSVAAIHKKLGVASEVKTYTDPKTKAEMEVNVVTGPGGLVFSVGAPRMVKPSAMQQKVDTQFADDVADFNAGGKQKAQDQINKLDNAISVLEDPGTVAASGPVVSMLPDWARGLVTTDKSRGVIKDIEQVVQTSLKTILGSQFAKSEADQLLARSFDPRMSEEGNAARVRVLKQELQGMLNARDQAVEYFRANGTLAGFRPAEPGTAPAPAPAPATPTGTPEETVLRSPVTLGDGRVIPAGTKVRKNAAGKWTPVVSGPAQKLPDGSPAPAGYKKYVPDKSGKWVPAQ